MSQTAVQADQYALTPHETVTVVERSPDRLVVEGRWTPGSSAPPAHKHPNQDERFTVLEGEMSVKIDGATRVLRTGDVLDIPRGTAHTMFNGSGADARMRWETMPAGRTEEFWVALSRAGRNPARQMAAVLRFRDTFQLVLKR